LIKVALLQRRLVIGIVNVKNLSNDAIHLTSHGHVRRLNCEYQGLFCIM